MRTPATKGTAAKEDAEEDVIVMDSPAIIPRYKLLQFHTNYRPAYFGSWRKKSTVISPRNPFRKDQARERGREERGGGGIF